MTKLANTAKHPLMGCMIVLLFFFVSRQAHAQVVHAGLKGGFQMSWLKHDDSEFKKMVKISPVPGYNVGAVVSFKVKDRYFLHTEYLFSTKGKVTKGRDDKDLKDELTHYYIDVPMLYNIFFKGSLKIKETREFKWYAGAGPVFSYWLGGRGRIYNTEFAENEFPALEYKIRFGERGEDQGETDIIYINNTRRFQLGLNVGAGIMLEPNNRNKIMIDLRMELGHTWIGKSESADYVIPVLYDDNLKARNMGIKFSVMYLYESNLNKKSRNKGKSTIKTKRRR